MKRAFWLVPVLAMFSLVGCAARVSYYSPRRPWVYEQQHYRHRHHHDYDRDYYRGDRWR